MLQVREDLCQVHEAYQYFRHKYKDKDKTLLMNQSKRPFEFRQPEKEEENENIVYQKLTLGVQHRGRITSKEATKVLR